MNLSNPRLYRPLAVLAGGYIAYLAVVLATTRFSMHEAQIWVRIVGALLPMIPLFLMAGYLLRLHFLADEVERVIHHAGAGTGFVAMLLFSLANAHLDRFGFPAEFGVFTWAVGIAGWLVGASYAFRRLS